MKSVSVLLFAMLFVAGQGVHRICPDPYSFGRVCVHYYDQCQSDAECKGEKCCLVAGCGKECMKVLPTYSPRNGCPAPMPYTREICSLVRLASDCREDSDCEDGEKCCEGLCGVLQCQPIKTNVCKLPKDSGPCEAAITRYYWNVQTKSCDTFVYGGCDGNGNNFETLEGCQSACAPKCDPILCQVFCLFGNVLDKKGCPTCDCKSGCPNNAHPVTSTSCEKDGDQCPDGATCVVPDFFNFGVCCRDEN